ncbi:MAG TPA: nitronate monooxygenase [Acidimicrobiales bacterium]|jgi:NAD(P)H-dependent flavin oxidoreductase YrpB (nitropropane dioxygenase family)|nr:nitronate monooxygenase [Acidimicrobiales bacterium]
MDGALGALGVANPVLAAPMAGGPTTPELVTSAAAAGSLGFLAGGYKTPGLLAEQIAAVRAVTGTFGVNLFAPNPLPVDRDAYRDYVAHIRPEAARYGLDVSDNDPWEDDDSWSDKIDLLLSDPVPVVSFTFGIPDLAVIGALRRVGTVTVQTVTTPEEALEAVAAGADMLAVQSFEAGGHSGTLHPDRPLGNLGLADLVKQVAAVVDRPLIGAGGLVDPESVSDVLAAGATAVAVGTALLRAPEAGTSGTYRAALAGANRPTVVIRAFTGRPARGIPNAFTDSHNDLAPLGYPALHHLTSPIRRAAAAAGDADRINLWAGTGYRSAGQEPVGRILDRLAQHI